MKTSREIGMKTSREVGMKTSRGGGMKTSHFLLAKAMFLVAVVGVSGCAPGKVTGGGWIPSTSGDPRDKANFGFNAAQCEEGVIRGRFDYHDHNAAGFAAAGGVKMNGPVTETTGLCGGPPCACAAGSYVITVDYDSTNPNFPGNGVAVVCVADNGAGINATSADMGSLRVATGPYMGYANSGPVQGNIRAHDCK